MLRWKCLEDNSWIGVFAHRIWTLRQDEESVSFETVKSNSTPEEDETVLLSNYLRLNEPLNKLYDEWAECDPVFSETAKKFTGVRMLQQEPIENIFTFICSSNNNISRYISIEYPIARRLFLN